MLREGDTHTATWSGVPSGRAVGEITLEVRLPAGAVYRAASADGIVEDAAGDGTSTYAIAYVLPAPGAWIERWRDTAVDPDVVVDEALVVDLAATDPFAPPWAPSVEEVAKATPSYTRGGFDDDSDELLPPGAEHGTYDATTSPTRTDVEGYIATACDEVAGRVGAAVPVQHYGLARSTAKWHVAASIAAGKQPAGTDDAGGEYRGHITNYRACLDRLVELCAMGLSRLH